MSKSRALVYVSVAAVAFSTMGYAVTPDRVNGDLTSGPKVMIQGNVHGLARPEFDQGRVDGSRMLQGITLAFRPSAAQQKALDQFIADLGNPSSKSYHKYLTPAQFADRFGMSSNDVQKIVSWLQSEGFSNIKVANSRNEVAFDGTIAQIEQVFALEMHSYLVNGEAHFANANNPSVPEALAASVLSMRHLHNFAPKPRTRVQPRLTSYVTGNHFLAPGDFATIYHVDALYSAGATGSGQTIAIVGQSNVNTTDLSNFRNRANLPASSATIKLIEGTSAICSGDEGESDLDIEWSGGVAKDATIIFLYAGLDTAAGDKCGQSRVFSVWDALNYAVQNKVAPFISTSYGFCESNSIGIDSTTANTYRGWAQQAVSQGQTIVAASGDSGAADCDSGGQATNGLAVDVPASIPEVTGAGGNEFFGDAAGTVTGTAPNTTAAATSYWGASNTGSDAVDTALKYIPEEGWNDTSQSNTGASPTFSASGGGVSIFFTKPSFQTGVTPNDNARDVPDISLSASQFHDSYLICSEDGDSSSCVNGFRDTQPAPCPCFTSVGGTSAAAPTFAAILALMNQYVGNVPPKGLAPVNPILYSLAASSPSAFHDVTSGNNIVPCSTGSPNCSGGNLGYSAATGYDRVTGLGSVDAFNLAQAYAATLAGFSVGAGSFSPSSVAAGLSTTSTITYTADTGFAGTITPGCPGLAAGAKCTFSPTTVTLSSTTTSGTTQLTLQTAPETAPGTSTVTVNGTSGAITGSTTANLTTTATTESFTLSSTTAGSTVTVAQGQTTSPINITVTSTSTPNFLLQNGSTSVPLTYSCSGLPLAATCSFSPGMTNSNGNNPGSTLTIQTTAPTGHLLRPLDRGASIFYAVLLPGLLGIVFTGGGRKRSLRGMRVLGLLVVLGLSCLWMASCGGTNGSGAKNLGTPTGSSTVTVNATTGGSAPLTGSFQFTLTVTP